MTKPQDQRPDYVRNPNLGRFPFGRLAAPFSTDWYAQVKMGLVENYRMYHQFGRNPAVGVTYSPVSLLSTYDWRLQAPSTLQIQAGGNAADDIAGLGAQKVIVAGFSDALVDATEEIDLAGASASAPTTTLFWRVNRCAVTQVGAFGVANTGTMTLETSGLTDILQIPVGYGQSQLGVYTVPEGSIAYIPSFEFSVNSTKEVDFRLMSGYRVDDQAGPSFGPVLARREWIGTVGSLVTNMQGPIGPFSEKSDIWFECAAPGGGGGADVSVNFEVLIRDNVTDAVAAAAQSVDFGILIVAP